MDYGSSRRKILKGKLGILLSMPSFAIGVETVSDARITEVVEEFIATLFIRHLKRTLCVTARKEVATDILQSLILYAERNRHSRSSDSTVDGKLMEHWGRFEACKKSLLETIINDFKEIFQVDLKDERHFDELHRDGNRLLHQISVLTGRGCVFKLMPCATASAFLCDMAIRRRCPSSSELESRVSEAQGSLEDILRVWLCCLDSAVFAIQEDSELDKEAIPDVQLGNWQSYLVASKTIFDWLARYHNFYPLFEFKETSIAASPAASPVPAFNLRDEDERSFRSNMMSVHSQASCIITEIYPPPHNGVKVRNELHQEILTDISQAVDCIVTVNERGEKLGITELSASCHAFSRKGVAITHAWPTNVSSLHEELIRSGHLERKHVYEITVHVLVSICCALFTESRYMQDVYGSFVKEFISSTFVELLTK